MPEINTDYVLIIFAWYNFKVLDSKKISTSDSSCRDSESGLYNYNHFRHALEQELNRLDKWGRPLSLALIKASGISANKWTCLCTNLCDCLRRLDIAARVGGDEIAVIMPDADEFKAKRWLFELNSKLTNDKNLSSVKFIYGLSWALPWEGRRGGELLALASQYQNEKTHLSSILDPSFDQHLSSAIITEEKNLLFDGFKTLETCGKY